MNYSKCCQIISPFRLSKHKGVNLTDIGPNYTDGFVQITSEHQSNFESLWQFRQLRKIQIMNFQNNCHTFFLYWFFLQGQLQYRKGDSTEMFWCVLIYYSEIIHTIHIHCLSAAECLLFASLQSVVPEQSYLGLLEEWKPLLADGPGK